jgi:hypothetical protein
MTKLSANHSDGYIESLCGRQAQNFATTLYALRDFLDLIAPQVKALDEREPLIEPFKEMLEELPKEARDRILKDIGNLTDALNESTNSVETLNAVRGLAVSREAVAIVQAMMNRVDSKPRLPVLLHSLVPMAVGAFEVLTAQLIDLIYHVRPGLLPKDEKDFSLSDLEQFDNLQDAIDDAIERRVDSILAGGIEHWAKWFSRKGIEIDFSQLALNWPDTLEIFQRRHIILHNEGKVSKRYLARLAAYREDLPQLGAEVSTDARYVQDALDNLNVLGSLLAVFVQRSLAGGLDKITAPVLNARVEGLMRLDCWQAAQKICTVSKRLKELPESARITFQCGEWFCAKELNGIETIRAAVEAWDTSALGQEFKAIRYSLLDMDREAAVALKFALRNGEVTKPRVYESPLLRTIEQRSNDKARREREDAIPDPMG